jgi:hypothetical protein
MKKILSLTMFFALLPASAAFAEASTVRVEKAFKNCTQVRKQFPNGVANSAKSADQQKNKPQVSRKIYNANKKLDRDRDGVICEK